MANDISKVEKDGKVEYRQRMTFDGTGSTLVEFDPADSGKLHEVILVENGVTTVDENGIVTSYPTNVKALLDTPVKVYGAMYRVDYDPVTLEVRNRGLQQFDGSDGADFVDADSISKNNLNPLQVVRGTEGVMLGDNHMFNLLGRADTMIGGEGDDDMHGGNRGHPDTEIAEDDEAPDIMDGKNGNNTFFLGAGDTATGGKGTDVFLSIGGSNTAPRFIIPGGGKSTIYGNFEGSQEVVTFTSGQVYIDASEGEDKVLIADNTIVPPGYGNGLIRITPATEVPDMGEVFNHYKVERIGVDGNDVEHIIDQTFMTSVELISSKYTNRDITLDDIENAPDQKIELREGQVLDLDNLAPQFRDLLRLNAEDSVKAQDAGRKEQVALFEKS